MIRVINNQKNERIGKLKKRIQLWSYTPVQNETGEETLEKTLEAEVWANIDYVRGAEKENSERLTAITNTVFTVRYDDRFLDTKKTIIYKTKEYDIEAAIEEGNEQFIVLTCTLKQ